MHSPIPKRLAQKIHRPPQKEILFSLCTLVTDPALYDEMFELFRAGGFDGDDVEFLYIDNSQGNAFDAYGGLNCLLEAARGEFVLLCHQDLVLIDDNRGVLEERLRDLDHVDPTWALAGNAGGGWSGKSAIRITDRFGVRWNSENFPFRAFSLDENFIVLRNSSQARIFPRPQGLSSLWGGHLHTGGSSGMERLCDRFPSSP